MTKHTYITKRDCPICDFCSCPNVRWRFPCSSTIATVAMADGDPAPIAVAESSDDWSACDPCAVVVVQRDPVRLAMSVISRPSDPEVRDALMIPEFRAVALENLMGLYTKLLPELGMPTRCTGFVSDDAGKTIFVEERR